MLDKDGKTTDRWPSPARVVPNLADSAPQSAAARDPVLARPTPRI